MISLAAHSDSSLATLVETARTAGIGGASGRVDVDGVPVFVKRIPLTQRELDHPLSTANLFNLPLHCQYGVGGHPGFTAWRELAANQLLTTGPFRSSTTGASCPADHRRQWNTEAPTRP
jgi:hypothetical protein